MPGTELATANHVFAGHIVGRAGVVGADDAAAAVLHLDLVGAEAGDGGDGVVPASHSHRHHQNDRRRADDHAQHGQQEAGLAGAEAVDRKREHLAEDQRRLRAGQRRCRMTPSSTPAWGR